MNECWESAPEILDLLSVLPRLMAPAIEWAEMQSKLAQKEGQSLDAVGLALAERVGVQQPEKIRIKIVDRLPLPVEPALRQAAFQTGLLGPGMVGLTLGYGILVVKGHLDSRLLAHECRHVHQYESYGSISAFLPVYLEQIATVGYRDAPLEQDARAHEKYCLASTDEQDIQN